MILLSLSIVDEAAQEALTDMPPRSEEELDPVTLHNQALMNMDEKPSEGFEKMQFLLQQPACPKEAFANLLLLYIKFEVYMFLMNLLTIFLSLKYLDSFILFFKKIFCSILTWLQMYWQKIHI